MKSPPTPHSEDRLGQFTITWETHDAVVRDWEMVEAILNSGIVIIGAVSHYGQREIAGSIRARTGGSDG